MLIRPIGKSGLEATAVVLGTWAIGGWKWGGTDEAQSIDAIRAALDSGINCIDTAPAYGFGLSETLVGRAVESRRQDVLIATKCGLRWDTDKGEFFFESSGKKIHRYLAADSLRMEVEKSLRNLNTDYIDLYQTHWQESTTPIEETMGTLMKLKEEGKIRAIGVCNATSEQMKQYMQAGQLDSDQEKYSMLDRDIEQDQLPFCRENKIAVWAYSPLALGILTGKIGPDREFSGDDLRINNPRFSTENLGKVKAMLDEFSPFAEKYNATMPQLVIAWTIAQPGLTHALVGARNPQQAMENAKAGSIDLTPEDRDQISAILAKHTPNIE